MAVALGDQRGYVWDELRQRLIAEIAQADRCGAESTYYERWLAAFESLLTTRSLLRCPHPWPNAGRAGSTPSVPRAAGRSAAPPTRPVRHWTSCSPCSGLPASPATPAPAAASAALGCPFVLAENVEPARTALLGSFAWRRACRWRSRRRRLPNAALIATVPRPPRPPPTPRQPARS